MTKLLITYFAAINLVTFVLAVLDRVARRYRWFRLPEKPLLALAWAGGSPAAKLAQILFRHKHMVIGYTTSLHLIVLFQATLALAVWGAMYSAKIKPEEGSILANVLGEVTPESEEEEAPPKPKRFGPGS